MKKVSVSSLAVAVAVAFGMTSGAAQATPVVSGQLSVNVWQASSPSGGLNSDATSSNLASPYVKMASFNYLGNINFQASSDSIQNFLDSAGGQISNVNFFNGATTLSTPISSGNFSLTTLFDITGSILSGGLLNISHDDGVSFCQGSSIGNCDSGSAGPTQTATTSFNAVSGQFRMIYSAANGLPEVLKANMAAVPLPATGLLLLGGLAGLAGLKRRRKAA